MENPTSMRQYYSVPAPPNLLGNEEINEGADFDIHIVTSRPAEIAKLDWATKLPGQKYLMQCLRPATGGVQKLTVLFATGQLDLILIPVNQLRLARMGLALGMERYNAQLRVALNEINTCIHGGHRMLKGDRSWGGVLCKSFVTHAGGAVEQGGNH